MKLYRGYSATGTPVEVEHLSNTGWFQFNAGSTGVEVNTSNADGKQLPFTWELNGNQLTVTCDDTPVVVPVITLTEKSDSKLKSAFTPYRREPNWKR